MQANKRCQVSAKVQEKKLRACRVSFAPNYSPFSKGGRGDFLILSAGGGLFCYFTVRCSVQFQDLSAMSYELFYLTPET
jgi:hypothetical protein